MELLDGFMEELALFEQYVTKGDPQSTSTAVVVMPSQALHTFETGALTA
jgi:hypothetical protein